jgi:hypothetical protein
MFIETKVLIKKWEKAMPYPPNTSFEEQLEIAKKNEERAKKFIAGGSSSTGCIIPTTASKKLIKYEQQFKVSFTFPTWKHSRFQERLLRFGIEFKIYKLEDPKDKDTERAIRESFCEDIVRRIESNLDDPEYISRLSKSYP